MGVEGVIYVTYIYITFNKICIVRAFPNHKSIRQSYSIKLSLLDSFYKGCF